MANIPWFQLLLWRFAYFTILYHCKMKIKALNYWMDETSDLEMPDLAKTVMISGLFNELISSSTEN